MANTNLARYSIYRDKFEIIGIVIIVALLVPAVYYPFGFSSAIKKDMEEDLDENWVRQEITSFEKGDYEDEEDYEVPSEDSGTFYLDALDMKSVDLGQLEEGTEITCSWETICSGKQTAKRKLFCSVLKCSVGLATLWAAKVTTVNKRYGFNWAVK